LSFFVIDIEWGRDQKRRCRCFLYGIYSWSSANLERQWHKPSSTAFSICNVSSLTALFLLGSDYFSESAWSRIRLPFSNLNLVAVKNRRCEPIIILVVADRKISHTTSLSFIAIAEKYRNK
jgi:hypothetical protein